MKPMLLNSDIVNFYLMVVGRVMPRLNSKNIIVGYNRLLLRGY